MATAVFMLFHTLLTPAPSSELLSVGFCGGGEYPVGVQVWGNWTGVVFDHRVSSSVSLVFKSIRAGAEGRAQLSSACPACVRLWDSSLSPPKNKK